MRCKLIIINILLAFVVGTTYGERLSLQTTTEEELEPTEYQSKISIVVLTILEKYHYRKADINDSLSSVIFDRYIEGFDHNKVYFLKSDLRELEKYRYELDDALLAGDLQPAFDIFNLFRQRFKEQNNYAISLISDSYDYAKDDSVWLDRESADWASSKKELNAFWVKYVKNEKLNRLLNGTEEDKIEENLTKHYENLLDWADKLNTNDVFQFYMNSVSETFDPHSNYLLPITYDNFMIGMSQSLEGIGARLQTDNEYTKVADIIPGGPAFKSKELFKDDRIVAVAQGDDGEWVNIIGWRIDDVVQLIRGPKDSIVRLRILKAEEDRADPVEIKIVRDKIKIEEAAPTKEIMTINRNDRDYRVGLITVPSFYLDFEGIRNGDPDYKSTTRDVKKLLAELQEENIDGLLIDLRNNGGGSLTEAIELTGLFIPDGPVVQIRNSAGNIDVQNDEDNNMYFDGPMGVLINRFSASASEIFSGAIQDYKRGVIIGEQSYGKGTVQNLLDLDRFIPEEEDNKPGQVKLTLAKFYRITGSSTQHKGVTPDIVLPSRYEADEFGESSMPSALPWDMISSTKFIPMNYIGNDLLKNLEKNSTERKKNDPEMIELINDIDDFKKLQSKKEYSLNLEKRKKEKEEAEKLRADRERLYGSLRKESEVNEVNEEKKSGIDDPYLKESLNIIADWLSYRIG